MVKQLLIVLLIFGFFNSGGLLAQTKSIELDYRPVVRLQGGMVVNWVNSDTMRLHIEAIDGTYPDVTVLYDQGMLIIDRDKKDLEEFEIEVKLFYPEVRQLITTQNAGLRGGDTYKARYLAIDADLGTQIDLPVKTDSIFVKASGTSQVILSGTCDVLEAEIKLGSYLDGYGLHCRKVDVQLKSAVKMEIQVTDSLTGVVGFGSELTCGAKPRYKKVKVRKGARVNYLE